MALDNTTQQQVFIEIFELEVPGVEGVTRRENVTSYTDAQRDEYARHFAGRIDRELYGVRLARVTVETLKTY